MPPTFPLKVRIVSTIVNVINDAATRRDGTINRRLLSFFDSKAPPNPTPINGVSTSDHTVDPIRNLKIRLFSPSPDIAATGTAIPVIVYFHGGGFVFNSTFSRPIDALCRRIARQTPAYVVSVEYRLAPEHRHPAAYDDGLSVLRWLDDGNLIIPDLSAVFIAGDSAGGNIAHHVARSAMTSSFKKLSVIGLVAIQPFFAGEEETESEERLEGSPFGSGERKRWMWRSFLPVGSDLDHGAANVFGSGSRTGRSSEEWEGFPATMVVIGGLDTMQDRQRWYAEGLRGVGVDVEVAEYENAFHAFQMFEDMPEAKQVIFDVAEFINRRRFGQV